MIQDELLIKQKHQRFVEMVCQTEQVIALESKEGYATSSANHFEDEDEEPIPMICFWSEIASAKACAKEGWKEYKPTTLSLTDFMENWCVGMHNDGLIVGTNFDQNMFGNEIEPLELALELIEELKKNGKTLEFKKFEGLDDFKSKILENIK